MERDDFDVQVGRRLRAAMVLAGMRTDELAEQLHVRQLTVQRHMRGDRAPDLRQLAAYAAALNVEPESLLPEVEWDVELRKWAPSDSNRQPTDRQSAARELAHVA